ncbi:NarK family nitrate/nitrite MFS transporter [Stenotrophomonas sp. YIM B06876]|uniref:NarK family nitrate/nitrite MFS transporter n=1 Tax=Stenotrophomonas sp. YIM B06876 TaxID=3060211 RepID=UPI002739FCF1|nr:NarK family nitrate/nitrite MFS transporter [Stenotrophomonas sp. YIM B06876]
MTVGTGRIERAGAGPMSVIRDWRPEDPAYWQQTGQSVARRNLLISVPALLLAFSVWMLFSAVAINLPQIGFNFSTDQLFWLIALPSLSGATLRVFYSFVVPLVGGRRWTAISTASLLLPTLWLGMAVQNPGTPYWVFVAIAMLCGLGGANFSSSMSNISFFYPKTRQGFALGLNAGLGNLGVSVAQATIPFAITAGMLGAIAGGPQTTTAGGTLYLQNAGFIWVPALALMAIVAWFGMNDLTSARSSFGEQAVIFRRKHNWLMCWLYVGTFGSYIGFSAGFPMLVKSQFPGVNPMTYAFIGPLLGALMRSAGGTLADKAGGALLTFWVFVLMIVAVIAVLYFLPAHGDPGNFYGFLAAFLALFVLSGIGNGSTFRMIPVIFRTLHERLSAHQPEAQKSDSMRQAGIESAAVVGFSGAIGAYGGFFIPKSYGTAITLTGSPHLALYGFIGFYVSCLALTWWFYYRRGAETPC